jgi:D-glycero-D-manno-heptose 1,7-bisphosphate phosphatase
VGEKRPAAVFLDRDGTLMRDVDYCGEPGNVQVFPGAGEALSKLRSRGYKIIIVTNQSGIARGYFDEEQYRAVEHEFGRQVGAQLIDATYFCPHGPDQGCGCRKPAPGLVLRAASEHQLDLTRSFFIGDKDSDMQCGRNAGLKTILVHTGYGQEANQETPDFVAPDLAAAVTVVLENSHA